MRWMLLLCLCACTPVYINTVPQMAEYSHDTQNKAADAYNALPLDSPLRPILQDCRYLRDQVRVKP